MNKILIQYQTHQVLTKRNSQNEMNHQFLKIETPHNGTTQSKHLNKNNKQIWKILREL